MGIKNFPIHKCNRTMIACIHLIEFLSTSAMFVIIIVFGAFNGSFIAVIIIIIGIIIGIISVVVIVVIGIVIIFIIIIIAYFI